MARAQGGERDPWPVCKATNLLLLEGPLVPQREAANSRAANFRGSLRPTSGGHFSSSSQLPGDQATFYCVPHPPLAAPAHMLRSPSGSAPRSRLMDLHELTCSPRSSAPAPSWATANSRKQPEGDGDFRCRRRGGEQCQTLWQGPFSNGCFGRKLGGMAKQDARWVTSDEAWAAH